jgi:hypothetical protein
MAMDDETLDVGDAVRTVEKALAYDAPLRARAEGLSWMVWGLLFSTVVLFQETIEPMPYPFMYAIWIPSVATAMVLGVAAVWRLAGIARPAFTPGPARVAIGVGAFIVGGVLTTFGFFVVDATGSYAAVTMAIAAFPWGLLAWFQWDRMTRAGRRAMVAAGAAMAVLYTTYVESSRIIGYETPGTNLGPFDLGLLLVGVVPFLLGLAWTFRR